MPRLTQKPPAYRLHRAGGQAVVTLNGRDHYLGPHGTKVSKTEYDRLVGEWLAHGRRLPATADVSTLTVNEVLLAYWRFVESHDTRDGKPTKHVDNVRDALRPLKALYGHTQAAEFGAAAHVPDCPFRLVSALPEWRFIKHIPGPSVGLRSIHAWTRRGESPSGNSLIALRDPLSSVSA